VQLYRVTDRLANDLGLDVALFFSQGQFENLRKLPFIGCLLAVNCRWMQAAYPWAVYFKPS